MSSNFLWNPGSGNNGLLATAVSLMTTELESLTNGSTVVSSVNGSSGVFNTSNTAQAMLALIFFSVGNPSLGGTPSAGGGLLGWFLESLDGGTTFEYSGTTPSRVADFTIPVPNVSIAAGAAPFKTPGPVQMPALPFKVLLLNNLGQTIGNGGTTAPWIKFAPIAAQY